MKRINPKSELLPSTFLDIVSDFEISILALKGG